METMLLSIALYECLLYSVKVVFLYTNFEGMLLIDMQSCFPYKYNKV